jgi:hypothetical protein
MQACTVHSLAITSKMFSASFSFRTNGTAGLHIESGRKLHGHITMVFPSFQARRAARLFARVYVFPLHLNVYDFISGPFRPADPGGPVLFMD